MIQGIFNIRKLSILTIVVSIMGLMIFGGSQAIASHCTTTVTSPNSIQTAIDASSYGDVVCLDDSGGVFNQTVIFGPEDSGITLSAENGDSPILDGTSLGSNWAIRLLDNVSDVTIEDLEIRNYVGPTQGNAIQAWDVSTSNILVRNNYMHDNGYNGILVGSEGGNGEIHSNWIVRNNWIDDHGFAGIELTNCNNCDIMMNTVENSFLANIVIQARNTIADSGLVHINGVNALHNTLGGESSYGVYVLSFAGHPTLFTPISNASTLLKSVNVNNNIVAVNSVAQIIYWAFNDAATAENGRINHNEIDCPSDEPGILVLESGLDSEEGTVKNVKAINNKFDDDCDPTITDEGESTKIQPPSSF